MEDILTVKNLTIEYTKNESFFSFLNKKYKAVKDVSFSLKKGEVLGIIGESGSGKTSLIKAIVGLNKVTSGEIIYNGKYHIENFKSSKEWEPIRSDIQMIFQNPSASLDPNMTIFDAIAEPLLHYNKGISKNELNSRVIDMMRNVCLHHSLKNKYTDQCSGGQNQRVAIARALIQNPKILLCDEPVASLDVSTQAHIMNLLVSIKKKFNLTLIFISHDLSIIYYISDYIFVMNKGEVVESSSYREIYENPQHEYTKLLINSIS